MLRMKYIFIAFTSTLMIYLTGCGASNTATKEAAVSTEKINPPSEATTKTDIQTYLKFDEFEHHLHREDNKIYVVNFWATWCKPCIKELPYFEQVQEQYKDKNVEVVLVSLDDIRKLETKIIPFVKEKNLQSTVILLDDADYNSWIDKVSPKWSGAIPATFIYNKNKREFYEQEFDYQQLENIVKTFL